MIEILDIKKRFGDKIVLDGVSITIKDGEDVAIIGKSGEGKSVFLKHVIGLLKPDSGDIIINGKSILNLPKKELYRIRRLFGYVFQASALFDSLTVFDNIALPLRERGMDKEFIAQRVKETLKMVELSGVEDMYPAELSGGMQKRVGIARAIAGKPQFILYDEPTTGLDLLTGWKINELIRRLNKMENVTGILVTHDIRSAMYTSDKIGLLSNGKLIEIVDTKDITSVKTSLFRDFLRSGSLGKFSP